MHTELLRLAEGRTLEVLTQGAADKQALIFHHGALSSSEVMAPLYRAAEKMNIFVIGITRPGYAKSSRRAGRRASNYYLETQAVADEFNLTAFVSLGWSSGGAAAISDSQDYRCKGVVTIAGDAPRVGHDWQSYFEKYTPKNYTPNLSQTSDLASLNSITGDELVGAFGDLLSAADLEICQGVYRDELAAGIRHGFSSGDFGVIDDFESDAADWGIDFSKIKVPVAVFQGDEDRMTTPANGHYLVDKIASAQLFLEEGQGHISLGYSQANRIITKALDFLKL